MRRFTVCVLLYGDHPELAERCLRSVLQHPGWELAVAEIRVGLNEVSPATRELVRRLLEEPPLPVPVQLHEAPQNLLKYPLMQHLFADPFLGDLVMWFDDDSFLNNSDPAWWSRVDNHLATSDMLGVKMTVPPQGQQLAWIRQQSWFRGRPLASRLEFIVGGWWVIVPHWLRQLGFPWPELALRGGDVMLGQALLQQGARLVKFSEGVAINADARGTNHAAPRRGPGEPPIGKYLARRS